MLAVRVPLLEVEGENDDWDAERVPVILLVLTLMGHIQAGKTFNVRTLPCFARHVILKA